MKIESGRSMVEMLGMLAIMGILAIGTIAGYKIAINRHKANDILSGASQAAMLVASKLQQNGNADDSEITSAMLQLGSEEIQGTVLNTAKRVGTKQFMLSFDSTKKPVTEICTQMRKYSGGTETDVKVSTDCSYLVYNNDLSTNVTDSGNTNKDGDGNCITNTYGSECEISCNKSHQKLNSAKNGCECDILYELNNGNCEEILKQKVKEERNGDGDTYTYWLFKINGTWGANLKYCQAQCPYADSVDIIEEDSNTYCKCVYEYEECLTGDTMITLADGTCKRVDQMMPGDKVLCINPLTNEFDFDEVSDSDSLTKKFYTEYDVWTFEDGSIVKTVHPHRFYNVEKQQMTYMAEWKIGEHGYNQSRKKVALIKHETIHEVVKHYTIFTKKWNNYFANKMLSGNRYSTKILLS